MQHTTLLICHECKEMLYSHIDLSKTNQTIELDNDHREANLSLLAEDGFKSHVHVCETCQRTIEEKIKENKDFENYHSVKWNELIEELNEIEIDIENIELIEEGYEKTKENEEQINNILQLKHQSYKQLLTLLNEITTFESQYKDYIHQKWFSLFNKCFSELSNLSDDCFELLGTIDSLKTEIKQLQQKHVFSSIFSVKRINEHLFSLNTIPFYYSIDRTSEFNCVMGKFVLGLYLMGKQLLPNHSIELLPFGNISQISVKLKENDKSNDISIQQSQSSLENPKIKIIENYDGKSLEKSNGNQITDESKQSLEQSIKKQNSIGKLTNGKKARKMKFNLFIMTKSCYIENDESFKEGFKYLMIYFNDIIQAAYELLPQLKQKQTIEIKPISFSIVEYSSLNVSMKLQNEQKSFSLQFNPNTLNEWNNALALVMKEFHYLAVNFDLLFNILHNSPQTIHIVDE